MNIFLFLFYIGIADIIFNFIWKWIFALPAAVILTLLKSDSGMRLLKIFGVYLIASLFGLITLNALGDNPGVMAMIFYPAIAGFILFFNLTSSQYETRKQASLSYDQSQIDKVEKDWNLDTKITISAVILYIFVLLVPAISSNSLIVFLLNTISWITAIPIIGWLVGFGGVLSLLNTIFHGFIVLSIFSASVFGKFRKEKAEQI